MAQHETDTNSRQLLAVVPPLLALAGAYGLIISVSYQLFFFAFAGMMWAFGFLTLPDFINHSVLPVFIGLTVAVAPICYGYSIMRTHRTVVGIRRAAIALLISGLIMLILVGIIFRANSVGFMLRIVLVSSLPSIIFYFSLLVIKRPTVQRAWLFALVLALPFWGTFIIAASKGQEYQRCPTRSTITTVDAQIITGPLVGDFDRGVTLLAREPRATVTIPWNRIAQLKEVQCIPRLPELF